MWFNSSDKLISGDFSPFTSVLAVLLIKFVMFVVLNEKIDSDLDRAFEHMFFFHGVSAASCLHVSQRMTKWTA